MFCWMCGKTRHDRIGERERAGVIPIVEKMVETLFGWFGYAQIRPIDFIVKRVDEMEGSQIIRGSQVEEDLKKL